MVHRRGGAAALLVTAHFFPTVARPRLTGDRQFNININLSPTHLSIVPLIFLLVPLYPWGMTGEALETEADTVIAGNRLLLFNNPTTRVGYLTDKSRLIDVFYKASLYIVPIILVAITTLRALVH